MWVVSYSDGSTQEFDEMPIEDVVSAINKDKEVVLIERL